MKKVDYKKEYRDLYLPKSDPVEITVPEISFIMIDGKGSPNDEEGEYKKAVELLYALSYTIKMSKMGGRMPDGYFDYVVPPLEGLWWLEDSGNLDFTQKNKYCWTAMIRQPEFVTDKVFKEACSEVEKKKHLNIVKARLAVFDEGLCVQCMHIGPFDDEPATLAKMQEFIRQHDLTDDISETRRHHEIYLSDPRKCGISKMKTVLRWPVRRKINVG